MPKNIPTIFLLDKNKTSGFLIAIIAGMFAIDKMHLAAIYLMIRDDNDDALQRLIKAINFTIYLGQEKIM